MTPEQRFDRLERLARLLGERPRHHRRESRKQTDRPRDYVTALGEFLAARQALEAKPDDSETNENLRRAEEVLDRTRNELTR
jgi:hypothetical protein